jgi:tRNA (guanine-N7-)-methyltransferase
LPGELRRHRLFFPIPWGNGCLVQPRSCELARVLVPGGLLHIATDWADYARHTREVLAADARFAPVDAGELRNEPLAVRPPTKFERRGVRLGHEVADLYYRTRPS